MSENKNNKFDWLMSGASWRPGGLMWWCCLCFLGAAALLLMTMWLFDALEMHIWIEQILDISRRSGNWAALILIGLMIAHNVVPIPAEMIAIAAGAVLGPVYGTMVIWTGGMLGAVLAFWIARKLGREFVERILPKKYLSKIDGFMDEQSTSGLLLVRLVPIVSFNVVNYGAGLTRVSWHVFLWTTAIGIIPITLLSVLIGAGASNVKPEIVLPILFVLVLGAMLIKRFVVDR